MQSHILTETANDGAHQAGVGDHVTLLLQENPTTGYRWSIDVDQGLSVVASELVVNAEAGVGAGGSRRFVIAPGAPGEFVVRAKLWREWQGESSVIKRFRLTLRVR